jgi:glycerophosphoryl diester phosphodiesterase
LVEAVLAAVYEAQAADRVALASFDDRLLYEAYRRDPSIPLIGIANSDEGIRTMLELPLAAVATRADLVEVSLERVPAGVAVWAFTAYSSDDAAELRNRGVHGIITDVPRAVVGSLRAEPDLYVRPNEP